MVIFGLVGSSPLHAQNIGYIQVTCEPGAKVFVDGEFKGVTSEKQGGLIISGVSATRHLLRFEKEGYHIQEAAVDVGFLKVLEYKVHAFTPKKPAVESGAPASPLAEAGENLPATLNSVDLKKDGRNPESEGEKAPAKLPAGQNISATKGDSNARSITDLSLKLIWIEPGSFVMGSEQGEGDEKPLTQVSISRGFWLGQTEVTQAQWQAIMEKNPSRFQGDELPVEAVNWGEAMEFCRKLTQREGAAGRLPAGFVYTLPTEAQWEYACRTGDSDGLALDLEPVAWYMANSGGGTKPVGQKQANAWGLHDMHGNVWEWCLDWYGSYPGGSVTDPKGAASSMHRVIRGGSWNNSAAYCRSGLRLRDEPVYGRNYLGFRLALSPVP